MMNTSEAKYYVYEWVRPDYNVVFYVGKGTGGRLNVQKRNSDTNAVIEELWSKGLKPRKQIIARFVNEQACLDFEIERISFLEPDGWLTNVKHGGPANGHTFTEKWCKEQSERITRFYQTPEGQKSKEALSKRNAELHTLPENKPIVRRRVEKQRASMIALYGSDEGKKILEIAKEKRQKTMLSPEWEPKREAKNAKTRESTKAYAATPEGKADYAARGKKCSETKLRKKAEREALAASKEPN